MREWTEDLRYALRQLSRSPGFAVFAIAALALGIGANTAIFSVVNSLLLTPLPWKDGERLVLLSSVNPIHSSKQNMSAPAFVDVRERNTVFEDMALLEVGSGTLTGFGEPVQVPGLRVTPNFFDMVGATILKGRNFNREDTAQGRVNVAILTNGAWKRFVNAEDVTGQRMTVDGLQYSVIGVVQTFWSPVAADAIVAFSDPELKRMDRGDRGLTVLAKLKKGVSVEQAQDNLKSIAAQLEQEQTAERGWTFRVQPVKEVITGSIRPAALALLGAVGMVLLIACANLANLLLVRASMRQRELAIRAAAGASRWRLIRLLLTESVLLGVVGGLAGLLAAFWGLDLMKRILPAKIPAMNVPGEVFLGQIRIDGTVLAFTAAISLFAGLLFGLLPAIRASRQESQDVLRQTTRGATAARGFRFLRNVLVAGEVALAVILSVGAALLLDTVANLQRVESGFQPNGVLTMSLELPTDTKYRTQATQSEFYRQMMAAILSKPGILSAGVTETVPLDREDRATRFRVAEKPEPAQGQSPFADYNPANAGYFETMRIPLVKGRMFNEQDDLSHPRVVVIDTTMANTYFPNEDPIGKHIIAWNGSHEIVGVVGAVRRAGLDREPTPTFYTSYLQSPDNQMVISVRSRLSNEQTVRAVKEAVWTVDKDQPLYQIRTMDEVVSQASSIQRTTTILLGAFALVALVLAAVGVYGVISYVVSQRTQEIGVRRALGAQTDSILWLVVGEGLKVAAFGVAAGVAGSLLLQRGLATLLYGVAGAEMWLLGAVSLLILFVASVASLMPARRAIQLDPMNALRYE